MNPEPIFISRRDKVLYKEDSIVDAIGYLALASEMKDKNVPEL